MFPIHVLPKLIILRDPSFIRDFKKKHAVEVFTKHNKTGAV